MQWWAEEKQIVVSSVEMVFGERNEAGQMLVDFCEAEHLVIVNTIFKHPKRRRYSWVTPDGLHRSQINFFLIKSNWIRCISNCRTCPGPVPMFRPSTFGLGESGPSRVQNRTDNYQEFCRKNAWRLTSVKSKHHLASRLMQNERLVYSQITSWIFDASSLGCSPHTNHSHA